MKHIACWCFQVNALAQNFPFPLLSFSVTFPANPHSSYIGKWKPMSAASTHIYYRNAHKPSERWEMVQPSLLCATIGNFLFAKKALTNTFILLVKTSRLIWMWIVISHFLPYNWASCVNLIGIFKLQFIDKFNVQCEY